MFFFILRKKKAFKRLKELESGKEIDAFLVWCNDKKIEVEFYLFYLEGGVAPLESLSNIKREKEPLLLGIIP